MIWWCPGERHLSQYERWASGNHSRQKILSSCYHCEFVPGEFLGGRVPDQVHAEGAVIDSVRFHPCEGANCKGAILCLNGIRGGDIRFQTFEGSCVPVIGMPETRLPASWVREWDPADIEGRSPLVENEVERAEATVVESQDNVFPVQPEVLG